MQALWSAPPSQFPRHTIVFWENKMNKQAEINPESSYLEFRTPPLEIIDLECFSGFPCVSLSYF